jgi:hypothetical protein
MTKHTAGEWKAVQADLHGDDNSRWAVVVDAPPPIEGQYFIATIENGAPGDSLKTEEANAQLLAASKALLEVAKMTVAAMELEVGEKTAPEFSPDELLAKAREAIARAEESR